MSASLQLGLFSGGEPTVDETFGELHRTELAFGAWYDYQPGWVRGADALYAHLRDTMRWGSERRVMYDREVPRMVTGTGSAPTRPRRVGRWVDTPRLLAGCPRDGAGHPLLERMRALLDERYGEAFVRLTMAWYRDGQDSVAMHGDTTARDLLEATVATVSLGAPRRFVLRPTEGGASRALHLGGGDLLVMGGTCQRTWRHGIPKVAHAGPRIAVMFRPRWGE
ncbi:MAG TPA: alpha-ketoglutarate-dependent dioxygenase AlkB [Kofleriaceae bacterium]|nr:alpha-ketoglutarate-dependent dioxygenase AlkB [Kofleriaceae bacterium]